MREPTREEVLAFYAHMQQAFDCEVRDKLRSSFMRSCGWWLDALKVMDRETFLNRYTTTIHTTIYTPFIIGEPHEHYTLWGQMVILVHECMHVAQSRREGSLRFAARYLTSDSDRAHYEAEALRCELEVHFWRTGKLLDLDALSRKLVHYSVDEPDIEYVRGFLESSALTIESGGLICEPAQVAIGWFNDYAPDLR